MIIIIITAHIGDWNNFVGMFVINYQYNVIFKIIVECRAQGLPWSLNGGSVVATDRPMEAIGRPKESQW